MIVRLQALKQDNDTIPQRLEDFPEMAQTTGTLPGKYTIKVDATAQGVVYPVKRQPEPLRQQVVDKLHEIEEKEVITPVQKPTDWVSSMVTVLRKGKVRICVGPSDLNKVIKREHHPTRTIEEVVSAMPDAKVFGTGCQKRLSANRVGRSLILPYHIQPPPHGKIQMEKTSLWNQVRT